MIFPIKVRERRRYSSKLKAQNYSVAVLLCEKGRSAQRNLITLSWIRLDVCVTSRKKRNNGITFCIWPLEDLKLSSWVNSFCLTSSYHYDTATSCLLVCVFVLPFEWEIESVQLRMNVKNVMILTNVRFFSMSPVVSSIRFIRLIFFLGKEETSLRMNADLELFLKGRYAILCGWVCFPLFVQ